MNLQSAIDASGTCYVSFPTLEAAVDELCRKQFGARLHLEAPPAEPALRGCEEARRRSARDTTVTSEELTAWMNACRRKDADIDKLLADSVTLNEETERLHAWWHEAVADASEQREEVKRLCGMLDACQSGNRTHSAEVAGLEAGRDKYETLWHAAELQCEFHHKAWLGGLEAITKLTAERNALHARVAELEKPPEKTYRDLVPGEIIERGDECSYDKGITWLLSGCAGVAYYVPPGKHCLHRRPVNSLDNPTTI